MAIIFYRETGEIYGVHPDANIEVPEGILSITVPQTPDKIIWPVPAGKGVGKEQWASVNPVTKALKAHPNIPIDVEEDLNAAIAAANTLEELKAALLGQSSAGKVAGKPV